MVYEDDDMPAPWIICDCGWLICLMCPMSKVSAKGHRYYLAVNTRRKMARQVRKWVRMHEYCGFEGLWA